MGVSGSGRWLEALRGGLRQHGRIHRHQGDLVAVLFKAPYLSTSRTTIALRPGSRRVSGADRRPDLWTRNVKVPSGIAVPLPRSGRGHAADPSVPVDDPQGARAEVVPEVDVTPMRSQPKSATPSAAGASFSRRSGFANG